MISRINTIAFNGLDILDVDLQVQISSGLPAFTIVGLPDKAVAESKERVRAALQSLGLSLPAKRITLNLAPADLVKEGSHFDLPVALGLLAAMGVIPQEELTNYIALGELGLDGSLISVNGILPAAIKANRSNKGLICPAANGSEAVWSGLKDIIAADNLLSIINHFKGTQLIPFPTALKAKSTESPLDMSDVKGQESAKKALEIAAAGAHNLLMIGPPGAGKSMLAARLPTILPPLTAAEALDTSIIHSVAGALKDGKICESGPSREIMQTPRHPYTKALFSAVPVPNPDVKMNRIILGGDIPSPANPPERPRPSSNRPTPRFLRRSPSGNLSNHLDFSTGCTAPSLRSDCFTSSKKVPFSR